MIDDPLDLFLQDFGVPVIAGSVTGLGILDMPGQLVADGMVVNTDYRLTVRTDQFGGLLYGDAVTVNGILYEVREALMIDDGAFTDLMLAKLAVGNGVFLAGVFEDGVFAA